MVYNRLMHTIKNIERFNQNELKNNTTAKASWHSDVAIPLFSTIVPTSLSEALITA